MSAIPFFGRRRTYSLIDKIGALRSVALYVGAGASIERTGLTWDGLCADLLRAVDPASDPEHYDEAARAATNEMTVSSAIEWRFAQAHGAHWRAALTDAIRHSLYGDPPRPHRAPPSPTWDIPTYFNERIASLANAYLGTNRRTVIVTPNYDGFLVEALREIETAPRTECNWERLAVVKFGVTTDGEASPFDQRLDDLTTALEEPRTLTVIHLHGFVAREAANDDSAALPVVSEHDYAVTFENSKDILGMAFAERGIVVVGSRLTDPPLTHALATLRPSQPRCGRYVIRPLQSLDLPRKMPPSIRAEVTKIETDRTQHLGISLVSPDYFCQAPQLLEEVRVQLATGTRYVADQFPNRYERRLQDWLADWATHPGDWESRSHARHVFLREQALPQIRGILECPDDELLKVEFWLRWPEDQHRLALTASSLAHVPSRELVRTEPITSDSGFTAVRAFLNGAPTYDKAKGSLSRWRAYLARPVRYRIATNGPQSTLLAHVPVGALSLASTFSQSTSSLRPQSRNASRGLFLYLDSIGTLLANAEAPLPDTDGSLNRAEMDGG
jgi:hypothetical protein